MSIKQTIVVPGVDVFFSRNSEKAPEVCPHCLSDKIKWSIIERTKLNTNNNGYSEQFDGFKMNCSECFAEIDFKEEK